jgi:hypothetical protein
MEMRRSRGTRLREGERAASGQCSALTRQCAAALRGGMRYGVSSVRRVIMGIEVSVIKHRHEVWYEARKYEA